MDLNSDGVVNQTEVIKIMDEVLTMFDKKMKADLSCMYSFYSLNISSTKTKFMVKFQ